MSVKKTLVFAPAAFNLAEVTRMIEVAKGARRSFHCVFISYDGARRHAALIEGEGFELHHLDPQMSPEDIQQFWAVDRGEKIGEIIAFDKVLARVEAELALYKQVGAVGVVTGFCLSVSVSARVAKLPLVWIAQTTWLREYAVEHAVWPDAFDYPRLRVLPERWLNALARAMLPRFARLAARPFTRASRRYGLTGFTGYDLLEGDHTLFAEPKGFSPTPVPARLAGRHAFIGPLIARLPNPVPAALVRRDPSRPLVYFAMGSSGVEETVAKIVEGFARAPYDVVAPIAQLVSERRLRVPENVMVTDLLPAHLVNPMADVSVIHGGIGTVLTACLSGTPIVGIGNGLIEQEHNLDCVVRKGFAVRLRHKRFTPGDVLSAVERYLDDARAKQAARAYAVTASSYDPSELSGRYLEHAFGS